MKRSPKETLLHDVLRDASDNFRQEVFQTCLKELRQKRARPKNWLPLPLAMAAAFVLTAGLLFFAWPHRPSQEARGPLLASSPAASVASYAPIEIVTNLGPAIAIVESRQYPAMIVQNSSIRQPVEIVGDTELLALFPDKPAGLIANAQGAVHLVLLDSRDQLFQ